MKNNNLIFLRKIDSESDFVYVAEKEWFQEKPLSETYDEYGQEIGHEGAQDYHPDNEHAEWGEHGDEEVLTTCMAYDYHDGNNWQSVVISCDIDQALTHEVITDEAEISELLKVLEGMEHDRDERGLHVYTSGDYLVVRSDFATSWEKYVVTQEDVFAKEEEEEDY